MPTSIPALRNSITIGYTGFSSLISFLPEKKIGVAVFTNHSLDTIPGILIAEHAYDLYLNNQQNSKKLVSQISKLIRRYQKGEEKSIAKFAKRKWMLTLPKGNYAGSYYNPDMGTIDIKFENEELVATYGTMKATSTPYIMKDCIRNDSWCWHSDQIYR